MLEAEPIEQILTQPVGCQLTEISHVVAILVSFASQPEVLHPGSSGARGLPLEPGAFESKRAFFRFFSIVTVGLIASKVFPTCLGTASPWQVLEEGSAAVVCVLKRGLAVSLFSLSSSMKWPMSSRVTWS